MFEYIPYKVLVDRFGDEPMSYSDLLTSVEWKIFRDEIVQRDGNKCKLCLSIGSERIGNLYHRDLTEEESKESYERYLESIVDSDDFKLHYAQPLSKIDENPTILNVHHTYYIKYHLPWNYPTESLFTICERCHKDIHSKMEIVVYKDASKKEVIEIGTCERCNGTGFLPRYHYHEDGVCFNCSGMGYYEFSR